MRKANNTMPCWSGRDNRFHLFLMCYENNILIQKTNKIKQL